MTLIRLPDWPNTSLHCAVLVGVHHYPYVVACEMDDDGLKSNLDATEEDP
jgi:hypothetical protein